MQNKKKRSEKRNFNKKSYNKKVSKSKLSQTYLQLIYSYLLSIKLNLVSHFSSYFDLNNHPAHKINKRLKYSFMNVSFKESFNEILAFLFITFFFVLAFYLGPSITGFTVLTHTSSSDFTGTYNRINKLKYLTKQIKKRGVK